MWLFETAAGQAVDNLSSKLSESFESIRGQRSDTVLGDTLRRQLLDCYGDEQFYNDLDSYLTRNKTIDHLIIFMRNPTSQQTVGRTEFIKNNCDQLLKEAPSCYAYSCQLKDVFSYIYDQAFSAVTEINPYSDFGRLQSDIRTQTADISHQLQAGLAMINDSIKNLQSIQNEEASRNLPDFSAEAGKVKNQIKEIEKVYQHQGRFEEALSQYSSLALSIADMEMHGEPKSTLLCALRCNIALCHSNLGNVEMAMDSLDKIPSDVAQRSETYNFVWASIIIQHKLKDQYFEALHCAENALKLKTDYHRAFFTRQHLRALLEIRNQSDLINELDAYFSKISDEEQRKSLEGDYYAYRGLICTAYNDSYNAYENYKQAALHGYDEFVAQFNMLSALYGQAAKGVPYGRRILQPNVDIQKLFQVIDGLKNLLQDERIENRIYDDVKRYSISLYVSASAILKGTHDLQPLQLYLPFAQDYETMRMLILGSKEVLSLDVIKHLNGDDQFFLEIRQLIRDDNLQKCREKIEQRLENPDNIIPAETVFTLLQLCIILEDSKSYRKYRSNEQIQQLDGDILTALDACAYELEGNLGKATMLFETLAQTSTDYHVLENVLRFYKRTDNFSKCETLYFRIQNLYKERKIYIDNLDNFYCAGLDFLISQKRNTAEIFFKNSPIDELSSEVYLYMGRQLYSAINDAAHLSVLLSHAPDTEFQSQVNQAICQRLMCHYDDGLELCLKLVQQAKGVNKEQLVKIYWLISDFYLFKKMFDESYSWALKAHQLMQEYPYDKSHSAFMGRMMRTGHFEGLSTILEYQKVHPVVVNYIKAFQISPEDENLPQKLLKEIKEYAPNAPDFDAQERKLASDYKEVPIPIHTLSQCFNQDWNRIFQFAQKTKLRLGTGNIQRQQLEESWIGSDIVVDAQTLIIIAACNCLPALQIINHVHISYSSVAVLQYCYLSNNYGFGAIDVLLDWLNTESTVILEPDGIVDVSDTLIQVLSKDFFAGCNIAQRLEIPFLCADTVVVFLQASSHFPTLKPIRFITIPTLCNIYGKTQFASYAQMTYQLLQVGEFISFSSGTMLEQIKSHDFRISQELLQPFLICKSDYDMQSFAKVYLHTISIVKSENETTAEELSELILLNAAQIWRRGMYYRETLRKTADDVAEARALAIFKYVCTIIKGIEEIWGTISKKLSTMCNELRETVADELNL